MSWQRKRATKEIEMTQFFKLVVALAVFGIGGRLALAGPLPVDPAPSPTAPEVKADPAGPITEARLGEMLEMMGLEITRGTYKSGALYFDTVVKTADYDLSVRIGMSPNQRVIWLMVYLGDVPTDTPAERLRAVLEAINSKTGKLQFRLTGNQLKADQPLDNFAVTPIRLRREIDDLKATIQATDKLWNEKKWENKAVKTGPTEPK